MQKTTPTRVRVLASLLGVLICAEIVLEAWVYPHLI